MSYLTYILGCSMYKYITQYMQKVRHSTQVSSITDLEKVQWFTLHVGPTDMGPLRLFHIHQALHGPQTLIWPTHSCGPIVMLLQKFQVFKSVTKPCSSTSMSC